jgi:uncharacterized protein YfdQ (DUF2303 family)
MIDADFLKEALATGAAVTTVKAPDGVRPYFAHPAGFTFTPVSDQQLAEPWRLKQAVTVFDPKSFTTYFTDFCNPESRIFVDLQGPAIVGVIDYHEPGNEVTAHWTEHRLLYRFRPTPEWLAWSATNRKPMTQAAFAEFIEDNLPDIVEPSHADMLEISRTMQAKKNVHFSSGVRLSNGEIQFAYEEEIRGTASRGTLEIPELFSISIAPFEGCGSYGIQVRLRYTIKESELVIRYELVRPHKIIEHAVNTVVETIRQGVTNPIIHGVLG